MYLHVYYYDTLYHRIWIWRILLEPRLLQPCFRVAGRSTLPAIKAIVIGVVTSMISSIISITIITTTTTTTTISSIITSYYYYYMFIIVIGSSSMISSSSSSSSIKASNPWCRPGPAAGPRWCGI